MARPLLGPPAMRNVKLAACGFVVVLAGLGCGSSDEEGPSWEGGPGAKAWDDDDVGCKADSDCAKGERCDAGVCQMERCSETYSSTAPMGTSHYFKLDREVAIVGDGAFIDGYEPKNDGYLSSWDLGGKKVIDVAGGNLFGTRPQAIAAAIEFSDKVEIQRGDSVTELAIGIWPKAIAVGDTDGDGIDELVAIAEDGSIARCHADTGKCEAASIDGVKGKDVTVGDVDGDGFEEPVFLVEVDGNRQLIVWNTDSELTGQDQTVGWDFGDADLRSIAAGDLDGDGVAEVVLLHERGWWDQKDDTLHLFSATKGEIVGSHDVNGHSIDVAVGDKNGDGKAEVAVLRSEHKYEILESTGATSIEMKLITDLAVGNDATRIATVDWDGDSSSGRLVSGPELVPGSVVPIALMMFPPYMRSYSDGNGQVALGNNQSQSEEISDTVSLHLGLTLSYGADIGPFFKAKVSGYFLKDYAVTKSSTKTMVVGQRYTVEADPEKYGNDYGAVVLSCGCFHSYVYETDDPADKMGGSGQEVTVFVPVGGQTAMWSTKRYNAMAAAVGGLPIMEIPVKAGDVTSYPHEHQTLAGAPVPDEDRVFPSPPSFQVSDIGMVSWLLSITDLETNKQAETTTVGMMGSLGALGVEGTVDENVAFSHAYSITVGKEAIFAGMVPALVDNPDTPEDEYKAYRYSFAPMVYREHYTDAGGEDAGYYVVSYAVGQ